MIIEIDLLIALGIETNRATQWLAPLDAAMELYEINSPLRQAAFLSQIAHESRGFAVVTENLGYSAGTLLKMFPARFNQNNVNECVHNPEMIANRIYANRLGNGDEASGDGWRFRGRGLIQVTGRSHYKNCDDHFRESIENYQYDLVLQPEVLEIPQYAALSAGWHWARNNLNALADQGNVLEIAKRISGGTLGLDSRSALYHRALKMLLA